MTRLPPDQPKTTRGHCAVSGWSTHARRAREQFRRDAGMVATTLRGDCVSVTPSRRLQSVRPTWRGFGPAFFPKFNHGSRGPSSPLAAVWGAGAVTEPLDGQTAAGAQLLDQPRHDRVKRFQVTTHHEYPPALPSPCAPRPAGRVTTRMLPVAASGLGCSLASGPSIRSRSLQLSSLRPLRQELRRCDCRTTFRGRPSLSVTNTDSEGNNRDVGNPDRVPGQLHRGEKNECRR